MQVRYALTTEPPSLTVVGSRGTGFCTCPKGTTCEASFGRLGSEGLAARARDIGHPKDRYCSSQGSSVSAVRVCAFLHV